MTELTPQKRPPEASNQTITESVDRCARALRDPNRIKVVLDKLREVWERNPDQRLAQLLANAAGVSRPEQDIYYLEDDVLLSGLDALDSMALPAQAMPTPGKISQIDATYFNAALDHTNEALESARSTIRHARQSFESLATESALHSEYRNGYAKMTKALLCSEQSIQTAEKENQTLGRWIHGLSPQVAPLLPNEVIAIRRSIEGINAAEIRLVGHCESVLAKLQSQDSTGLIDWTMPFAYHFRVLLDPGPARAFYQSCGDGDEPLPISIGPYSAAHLKQMGAGYNWNCLASRADNPLREDHHGYLVHCIIDHSVIPWQMIGHIKEVEVDLEFHTLETAWIRSSDSS